MQVIIDRFEEDIAVIEADGRMLKAPRALFSGAHEGDAVEITVLGKPGSKSDASSHAIFERLRAKSRSLKTGVKTDGTNKNPAPTAAEEDA